MVVTRPEAAEKTDAGRVAPIRACVFYQIDRLKSGFEAMGRTVMPGNCALMEATRPASEHFSAASSRVRSLRQRLTDRRVLVLPVSLYVVFCRTARISLLYEKAESEHCDVQTRP